MPRVTATPAATAMSTPREGTPKTDRRANSPPASIAATEEKEAITTPVRTAVPSGSAPSLPAVMNSAASAAMNTADNATPRGAVSPKNTEISRPEANPAPITVPM